MNAGQVKIDERTTVPLYGVIAILAGYGLAILFIAAINAAAERAHARLDDGEKANFQQDARMDRMTAAISARDTRIDEINTRTGRMETLLEFLVEREKRQK